MLLAAGLGYGVSSYTQTPTQTSKKPQYGSVKEFEKVNHSIATE
jgi:D-lactate dehydrogenase (cytochrome)